MSLNEALIVGGSALASSGLNFLSNRSSNAQNFDYWKKMQEYNKPANQVSRLRAAGINPFLNDSVNVGNAQSQPQYQPTNFDNLSQVGAAVVSALQNRDLVDSQVRANDASARGSDAGARKNTADAINQEKDNEWLDADYNSFYKTDDDGIIIGFPDGSNRSMRNRAMLDVSLADSFQKFTSGHLNKEQKKLVSKQIDKLDYEFKTFMPEQLRLMGVQADASYMSALAAMKSAAASYLNASTNAYEADYRVKQINETITKIQKECGLLDEQTHHENTENQYNDFYRNNFGELSAWSDALGDSKFFSSAKNVALILKKLIKHQKTGDFKLK